MRSEDDWRCSAATALAAAACGSTSSGAVTPRPPAPVNLTVYIDNSRVSVSPTSVGAGPVTFIITNQASQAESLAILRSGASAGQPLAEHGADQPPGDRPGDGQLLLARAATRVATGGDDAGHRLLDPAGVDPRRHQRASSDNQVLQP